MNRKVLIVDDEMAIRDMLHFALDDEPFQLIDAENASQAMALMADRVPDLVLLDWMLPERSGIDLIKWMKKQPALKDLPIIMLTAKAEEENKIKGLMTGADDYIIKPFSPQELIARIKTVLRRSPLLSPEDIIRAGDLELDTQSHQVNAKGNRIHCSPIEYKMLNFFMQHPNRVYSRDHLITHVWGGDSFIDDRTVDAQIRRLRDKLKQYDCHHYIRTVRGFGYKFSTDHE